MEYTGCISPKSFLPSLFTTLVILENTSITIPTECKATTCSTHDLINLFIKKKKKKNRTTKKSSLEIHTNYVH